MEGGIYMNTEKAKQIAYDLSIEYIRTHPEYMNRSIKDISEIVEDFAKIHTNFYADIINSERILKLYEDISE